MPGRDIDILHQSQVAASYCVPPGRVHIADFPQAGALEWLRIKGVPAFFRPGQLRDFGLTPAHLPALMRYGVIQRVCRGLYRRVDEEPSDHCPLAVASARSPGSIVCLHSALRVHEINSTETSANVWLAIPQRSRAPRMPNLALRILHFSGMAWAFRVTEAEFDGVPGRITTPARTILDCFRFATVAGAEAGPEALWDALNRRLVTIEELMLVERALPCLRLRALLR
jgi:hypothetical protein